MVVGVRMEQKPRKKNGEEKKSGGIPGRQSGVKKIRGETEKWREAEKEKNGVGMWELG